jgi:CBS domain-containing membrane protein
MDMNVRDLMTEAPITLGPESDLAEAYDLMDTKGVRHLPVTNDEGELLGLVSHRDLVKTALNGDTAQLPLSEQRRKLHGSTVSDVMTFSPETVSPDTDAKTAGMTMFENKFGCLPVVDGDTLVGILTEADYVRYFISE